MVLGTVLVKEILGFGVCFFMLVFCFVQKWCGFILLMPVNCSGVESRWEYCMQCTS